MLCSAEHKAVSSPRARTLVQVTGSYLVALAIASLLALSVAQAHCSQILTLSQHDTYHVHGARHDHHTSGPTTPPQAPDDCCGVLCTVVGYAIGPRHAFVPTGLR